MAAQLALGTAQFGLPYGINNTRGQVPAAEIRELLRVAHGAGIDTLDTAYAYGTSEQVLGEALDDGPQFRIVSKYPADDAGRSPTSIWGTTVERLGGRDLYGYLLHGYAPFRGRPQLVAFLQGLRRQGKVQRTGFSLYDPTELEEILERGLPFELVQVPCSVLDQRFIPFFPELQRRGVEVHTRSAFLQGLVFRAPELLGAFFRPALAVLREVRATAERLQMSVADLCLGFCRMQKGVDRVVVGVDGSDNLLENIASAEKICRLLDQRPALARLRLDVPHVLNPSRWEKS